MRKNMPAPVIELLAGHTGPLHVISSLVLAAELHAVPVSTAGSHA
jgi:hypothetical protein